MTIHPPLQCDTPLADPPGSSYLSHRGIRKGNLEAFSTLLLDYQTRREDTKHA